MPKLNRHPFYHKLEKFPLVDYSTFIDPTAGNTSELYSTFTILSREDKTTSSAVSLSKILYYLVAFSLGRYNSGAQTTISTDQQFDLVYYDIENSHVSGDINRPATYGDFIGLINTELLEPLIDHFINLANPGGNPFINPFTNLDTLLPKYIISLSVPGDTTGIAADGLVNLVNTIAPLHLLNSSKEYVELTDIPNFYFVSQTTSTWTNPEFGQTNPLSNDSTESIPPGFIKEEDSKVLKSHDHGGYYPHTKVKVTYTLGAKFRGGSPGSDATNPDGIKYVKVPGDDNGQDSPGPNTVFRTGTIRVFWDLSEEGTDAGTLIANAGKRMDTFSWPETLAALDNKAPVSVSLNPNSELGIKNLTVACGPAKGLPSTSSNKVAGQPYVSIRYPARRYRILKLVDKT